MCRLIFPMCFMLLLPIGAQAESTCSVVVRSIKASVYSREFENKDLRVGADLSDMREQLEPLPYRKFEILSSKSGVVSSGDELVMRVGSSDGAEHVVKLMPENSQVLGMDIKIRWIDERNETILDTKVNIKNQRPVVVGVDHEGHLSTVLGISAECH